MNYQHEFNSYSHVHHHRHYHCAAAAADIREGEEKYQHIPNTIAYQTSH